MRFWRAISKTLVQIGLAIALGQLLLALALFLFFPAKARAEWRAVTDADLSIRPGNALDFSALVAPGPAGKNGHVIATPDGHFAFAKTPAKAQRFMCASQPWGIEEGFPDHDTADRYAQQLRLHGYNLARFHFVENVLMNGRNKDFDFDPEQLDRFHYFMAALKREGIYWMLDALTSWNGAYGDVGPDRWADKRNVKLGVYFNKEDQEHWRRLVDKLLAAKNPYTGLAPLRDPALVAVTAVNEGGLNSLLHHQPSAALNREFSRWLAQRYGNVDQVMKKWESDMPPSTPMELPRRVWDASPRMADAQRFYFDAQANTLHWMRSYLRNLGYKGFITGYDNWFTVQDIASRAQLDLVTAHAYFDEPQGFASPGTRIKQSSSLQEGLPAIRDLAAGRYWNKPFAVTEYDQPFWNRYRYESGLATGAYAAMQNWDLICRHASGPIELEYGGKRGDRHQIIYPFGAGVDPVARASETVAALLFLRGDVKPSSHRTLVRLTPDYVFEKQSGIGFLPGDVNQFGLLTGVGVQWDTDGTTLAKNSLLIHPDKVDNTKFDKFIRKAGALIKREDENRANERVKQLRKAGILSTSNASDIRDGLMESDTGQIKLDVRPGILSVITEKTEAYAFDKVLPAPGSRLAVKESTEPALIAASSLDGAILEKSGRILIIVATDARNSGMSFTDASEKILDKLGGKPVLMKTSQVHLQLKHDKPEKLRLYALKLNGERGTELPLKKNGKLLDIVFDTARLPDGPTTYFELTR
ncbi:MAG: beta-galactosidase [Burkholderiales bacterium]|nr:beta-galactosidase [Burkholderiales bacterium]